MPHITIQISRTPDSQLTKALVKSIGVLTHDILGKKPNVTSIQVKYASPDQWFIEGKSLAEWGKTAFHLDITITDETNTKQEKARYMAEAYAALSGLLGDVHTSSFIHIIDTRAAAYGYGGLTQEYRLHHS